MRTRILTTVLVGLTLFLIVQGPATAVEDKVCVKVFIGTISTLKVFPKGDLNWTDQSFKPRAYDFNAETKLSDHPKGWTVHPRVKFFLINSNSPWIVTVQGTDPYFTCDSNQFPGAWQEKPVGDIVFCGVGPAVPKSPGVYEWYHLTTSPTIVETGKAGKHRVGTVFFRVLLDWKNDSPGNYHYQNVIFTLGAQ